MNKHEHAALIEQFRAELADSQSRNIDGHVRNVDYFLGYAHRQGLDLAAAAGCLHPYLGSWFVGNFPNASETQLLMSIASIRKFYQFLVEQGHVPARANDHVNEAVELHKEDWLDIMDQHGDDANAEGTEEELEGARPEEDEDEEDTWAKPAKISEDEETAGLRTVDENGMAAPEEDLLFGLDGEEEEEAEPEDDDAQALASADDDDEDEDDLLKEDDEEEDEDMPDKENPLFDDDDF